MAYGRMTSPDEQDAAAAKAGAEFAALSDEERIGYISGLEQQSNRRQADAASAALRRFLSCIRVSFWI
jgi:hypothetical protein